jgi:hypothetical protein
VIEAPRRTWFGGAFSSGGGGSVELKIAMALLIAALMILPAVAVIRRSIERNRDRD